MNEHGHRRHRALVIMVCCEIAAFACTLAAAWPANSLILWANCLRVGIDLPASFFALYVSRRILDERHGKFDYGLGKWENLAALINVPILISGLFFLAFRAVQNFANPQPVVHIGFGVGVLLFFAILNVVLMRHFASLQREVPSPLVQAQFVLYRNAAAASLFSLLALAGARISGSTGAYFDILGAAALSVIIVWSALLLLRQALSALLDEAVEESLQTRIEQGLESARFSYRKMRRIRSRHAGSRIFVEIFLEFDPDISARELVSRSGVICRSLERDIPGSEITVIPCAESEP